MTTANWLPRSAARGAGSHHPEDRVLIVLAGAMGGFLIYGIVANSFSVTYYLPTTIILTGVIASIHRSVGFSTAVLWSLAGIAIGNVAGGVLLISGAPLYVLPVFGSIRYDKVFHAVATGVVAWASLQALASLGLRPTPALAFAAAMTAIGAGGLVEVAEYVGSQFIENDSIGGYDNNMQDLIANTAGAVVSAVWAHSSGAYPRRRSEPIPVKEPRTREVVPEASTLG